MLPKSPNMAFRQVHQPFCLLVQGNKHYIDLIFLVSPIFLDLSTWTSRQKCWLRLSRPSSVTSVGAVATFSLPSTMMWIPLCMMNLLICFPGRLIFWRSTGSAPWMTWYFQRIMVRVTDLTWLLIIGVTWLFSYISVIRRRTFPQVWYFPQHQHHVQCWVQYCTNHHQTPTRWWRDRYGGKIANIWSIFSEETSMIVHRLYIMEKIVTDHQNG